MHLLTALGIIVLLILLNGFFSLAEMALVAARKVRLQSLADAGDPRARTALDLKKEPDRFFSTVQIGITLVGILTGAFGGAALAQPMEDLISGFPLLAPYGRFLGLVLVVLPVAYLTLVVGELVPKQLALTRPEALARMTAPVMRRLMLLSLPVVHLLSLSTTLVIRLMGGSPRKEPTVTEEDLRGLIREAALHGEVEFQEKEIMERIFRLGDRRVSSLMVHRTRVVWLDPGDPHEKTLETILNSPYSRFPIARKGDSQPLGVVRARDYLTASLKGVPELSALVVRPLLIPESMRALQLLELFKERSRMHFAFVLDEWGDIQGIVTLNDVLEAIVGDFAPLAGSDEPLVVRRDDGSWLLDGLMPIDEVRDLLGLRVSMRESERAYETLAGFVLTHLGRIPDMGDVFHWSGYRFEVVDMDGRRIDRVLVIPPAGEEGSSATS